MIATLVNAAAVLGGTILGLLVKKFLHPEATETIYQGLGLCVVFIAIKSAWEVHSIIVVIVCMALGGWLGETLKLQQHLDHWAQGLQEKYAKKEGNLVSAFIAASLLFCVGGMSIVGSFEAGLNQNYTIIFTKSAMDCVAAAVLSATMGFGVVFACGTILVYQGALTLLAGLLQPLLTQVMITDISCTGSLLILATGLTQLKVLKIRLVNLIPAMFLPVLFYLVLGAWL
ncbi:MAG: DUF554 domain-containing protein [Erysipelotrichaceae bacterium]|jgi:uncharacterized membrane protein YqgA involved in biofilm formation|nr:DUF554 domain-containing protein [Erysipelotrichaceae bacterium]